METFYDQLTRWQPFFSAVASVAATLAGLLFVSLSLNRERITAKENRALLRLARRSFANFLYPLFIALIFLVPNHHAYGLAVPLFCLGIYWAGNLVKAIVRWMKVDGKNFSDRGTVVGFAFQILTCGGLLAGSLEIWRGQVLAVFFLVPVVALLLVNATLSAWELLLMERKAEEKG